MCLQCFVRSIFKMHLLKKGDPAGLLTIQKRKVGTAEEDKTKRSLKLKMCGLLSCRMHVSGSCFCATSWNAARLFENWSNFEMTLVVNSERAEIGELGQFGVPTGANQRRPICEIGRKRSNSFEISQAGSMWGHIGQHWLSMPLLAHPAQIDRTRISARAESPKMDNVRVGPKREGSSCIPRSCLKQGRKHVCGRTTDHTCGLKKAGEFLIENTLAFTQKS